VNAPVPLPHPTAARIGQGTAIEQSRAAAEVYASVLAADARHRNKQDAIKEMRDACGMRELAERAFYRFPRGKGKPVTGATIHLARELARCWGNISYGVAELRRDDVYAQSEMQAFAWDLQTNARASAIFIVPHARDKTDGGDPLTSARDIYENNANAGARRVREALFALMPLWFVEQAKAACTKTLEDGGGKPLPQRIAAAIELFAELGVSEQQLEAKVGLPTRAWTALDLAPLTVIYQSIQRGEISRDEEFPPAAAVITAADLAPPVPDPGDAQPAKRRPAPRKTSAPGKTRAPAGGAAPEAADPDPSQGPPLPGEDDDGPPPAVEPSAEDAEVVRQFWGDEPDQAARGES